MNIKEFKQKIDGMFPCRWENDFLQDIRVAFEKYINLVSSIDCITGDEPLDVVELCAKLTEVIKLCYDGRKGKAFDEFRTIMNGNSEVEGLFSSIDWVDINAGELFYRARKRKPEENFSIQDMFHIPLNKRGIVSQQRFSSSGYPCLYLGNSVYSCWEELQRPLLNELLLSAFKVRHTFRVFDMRLPGDSDYYPERITHTIKRIPLVLACGFAVNSYDDKFKPEYIIPQMLVETIIDNNRIITQREKSAIDPDVIWGVLYTSTHVSDDFPYNKFDLKNIVLPVIESDNPSNYCYCLASLFDISLPLCYEYESFKENTTSVFRETIDKEKTNEEIVREQHEQLIIKMRYLEERLRNTQFETLNHIVIDSPNEGITLDSSGHPVSIRIRSNVPFTIE